MSEPHDGALSEPHDGALSEPHDGALSEPHDGALSEQPKVVAIGGGHGLAASLRAVRTYTDRITAIVSVADDGGSSGRLRQLLHIIPPGDLRMCLVALAEPGSLLASAFEFRFADEELARRLADHAMPTTVFHRDVER